MPRPCAQTALASTKPCARSQGDPKLRQFSGNSREVSPWECLCIQRSHTDRCRARDTSTRTSDMPGSSESTRDQSPSAENTKVSRRSGRTRPRHSNNYRGGCSKLSRGLPSAGAQNPTPLVGLPNQKVAACTKVRTDGCLPPLLVHATLRLRFLALTDIFCEWVTKEWEEPTHQDRSRAKREHEHLLVLSGKPGNAKRGSYKVATLIALAVCKRYVGAS